MVALYLAPIHRPFSCAHRQRRKHLDIPFDIPLPAVLMATWNWRKHPSSWIPYDASLQCQLEEAYLGGHCSVDVERNRKEYRVEFKTWRQVNLKTFHHRQVKRIAARPQPTAAAVHPLAVPDVFLTVLSFAAPHDLASLHSVCRQWRACVASDAAFWRRCMGYIRGDATEEDSDMALQGAVAWGVFCHLLARNSAGKVAQSTGMGSVHTLEFRSPAVHVDFDLFLGAFEARAAGAATNPRQPNAPAQCNATLPWACAALATSLREAVAALPAVAPGPPSAPPLPRYGGVVAAQLPAVRAQTPAAWCAAVLACLCERAARSPLRASVCHCDQHGMHRTVPRTDANAQFGLGLADVDADQDVRRSPWAPYWVMYVQAPQHVAEAEAEAGERAVTLLFNFGRGRVRSSWGGADVAKPAPPQSAADTLWRGAVRRVAATPALRGRCGQGQAAAMGPWLEHKLVLGLRTVYEYEVLAPHS